MQPPRIVIEAPEWLDGAVDWNAPLPGDAERMGLAIRISRENVRRGTGGPFAALVIERDTGHLVSVGTNSVLRHNNSVLHGEIMAIMLAQQRLRSWTLHDPALAAHELVTSCDPCAMCLGAVHWSGVRRLVCGAMRDDATATNFDEGPVFPESFEYLRERGVEVVRGVMRAEARAVLREYRERGGPIYNA